MVCKKFGFGSTFKLGLMALVLNLALSCGAYASVPVPTEDEIVASAQTYMDDPWGDSTFIFDLKKFATGASSYSLGRKLSSIKDADGNNLAHVILKNDGGSIDLHTLLKVTGTDILKQRNRPVKPDWSGSIPPANIPFHSIDPGALLRRLSGDKNDEEYRKFRSMLEETPEGTLPFLDRSLIVAGITSLAKRVMDDPSSAQGLVRAIEDFPLVGLGWQQSKQRLVTELVGLRDKDDNNLAHKFLDPRSRPDFRALHSFLKFAGPGLLDVPNTAGLTPLRAYPLEETLPLLMKSGGVYRDREEDEKDYQAFRLLMKSYVDRDLKPAMERVDVAKLLSDVDRLEKDPESRSYGNPKYEELEKTQRYLGSLVQFKPSLLSGQKLEILEHFFDEILATSEGRELLRNYKVGRQSLTQYYSEKKTALDPSDYELANKLQRGFGASIAAYFLDKIPVTPDVWDITEFSYEFLGFGKDFLTPYRNSQGQNLAHLAARTDRWSSLRMLESLKDRVEDDAAFVKMLKAPDLKGETPALMIAKERDGIEFLKNMDPTLLITPFGPYKVTPLMLAALSGWYDGVLASLAGTSVDQRDAFGNTAAAINVLAKDGQERNLVVNGLRAQPLQADFWDNVTSFPYYPSGSLGRRFVDIALEAAKATPQIPLYKAFWQIDASQKKDRDEANAVWRSFFKTYDGVADEEAKHYGSNPRLLQERKRPLSVRVLETTVEFMSDVSVKVLSGASSFGVNFARKVKPEEAGTMMRSIERMVDQAQRRIEERADPFIQLLNTDFGLSLTADSNIDEAIEQTVLPALKANAPGTIKSDRELWEEYFRPKQETMEQLEQQARAAVGPLAWQEIDKLMNGFFQAYPEAIDTAKQTRLLNHQLNCAVVALHSFARNNSDAFGINDEDQLFGFIDRKLQAKTPGMVVNSRARFDRVHSLLGDEY